MKQILILITLIICGFYSISSPAQTPRSLQNILNDSVEYKKPLPISEIVKFEKETQNLFKSLQNEIELKANIEDIEKKYIQMDSIVALSSPLSQEQLIETGSIRLQNLENEWLAYQSDLKNWSNDLRTTVLLFENRQKSVFHLKELWQSTLKTAVEENAPNEVILLVEELLNGIDSKDKLLNNSRNTILKQDLGISSLMEQIQLDLGIISQVKEETIKSLYFIESPVLWIAFKDIKNNERYLSFNERFKEIVNNRLSEILNYIRFQQVKFYFGLFSFFIFYAYLTYLRKTILHWLGKESSVDLSENEKTTYSILNKSLASAVLLTLLLLALLFFKGRPVAFKEILTLVAIFPLLRVVTSFSSQKIFSYLLSFSILIFLGHINNLIIELPLINRLILLVLAISIVIFFIVVITNKAWQNVSNNIFKLILLFFSWFSLLSATTSTISNVMGNVTLAGYLVYGILNLFYFALVVLVITTIFIKVIYITFKSPLLQSLLIVQKYEGTILTKISNLLVFAGTIIWLSRILKLYEVRDSIILTLSDILIYNISIGSFNFSLGDILLFFLVIWLGVITSRVVCFFLEEEVFPRTSIRKGASATISTFARVTIVTLGFILAIAASGFPMSQLTVLIGAFGVGIGFGLQSIFNNLVSGFIIATERPMEVGDVIEVGTLVGEVREVGIRSSIVRTYDGAEVIVPNGNLISNQLINWTHSDQQRRIKIKVGVAYGTDIHKVIKILEEIGQDDERIMKTIPSYVLFRGFGESSLDFELRCWTQAGDWIFLESDLKIKVNDALSSAKIKIPFPQRDLHIRSSKDDFLIKSQKKGTKNMED